MTRALFAVLLLGSISGFLCGEKPYVLEYGGRLYFPFFFSYPASEFGEEIRSVPDYKKISAAGHRAIFPLIPYGENESTSVLGAPPPSPPDARHWLGTDDRGRDLLVRLIFGLRNSLLFAAGAWLGIVALAVALGLLPGYLGGRADFFAQRATEIWSSLPGIYVILLLVGVFSGSWPLLWISWALLGWMPLASLLRAEGLRLRGQPFLEAARAMGLSRSRIFFSHVLPNALTPVLTLSPFLVAYAIGGLAALDYLGMGLPPPAASWGELLHQGKENRGSWWLTVFPFLSLFLLLLLLVFVGENFRARLQPKRRFL